MCFALSKVAAVHTTLLSRVLTSKLTSSLLQAVFVTQDRSSSLHMYVLGSLRFVDTSSLVSKPEPHVDMVTSVSRAGV